jgi:hypothetical protein
MRMIAPTAERVERHTAERIQERIDRDMERRLEQYADRPEDIHERLAELDREWDIERAIEANASSLMLAGTLLGAFVDRRFLLVPAAVSAFLLQHAVQGWCPPVPILRRLGFRTQTEIERERYALKALRGDFDVLCPPSIMPY